jgi:membrane protease YdiL (CAAX protease family)
VRKVLPTPREVRKVASLRTYPGLQATVAVAGLAAFTARAVGWEATAVVVAVGGAAALLPDDRSAARADHVRWVSVVLLGVIAFGIVRLLTATPLPRFILETALAGSIAAVAEEVFFRRFLYGWLARWSTSLALVGSAVAFAVVHLPLYGPSGVALDLAAGLLFGWQRWSAGSWTAPAVTHVAANLMSFR